MFCGSIAIADILSLILLYIELFCCCKSCMNDDDGLITLFAEKHCSGVCKFICGCDSDDWHKVRLFIVRFVFIPRVLIFLTIDIAEVVILCVTNEEILDEGNLYLFILCITFLGLQFVYFIAATCIVFCNGKCIKPAHNHLLLILLYKQLDMIMEIVLLVSVYVLYTGDFLGKLFGDMNIWSKIIIYLNAADLLWTLVQVLITSIRLCRACQQGNIGHVLNNVVGHNDAHAANSYSGKQCPRWKQFVSSDAQYNSQEQTQNVGYGNSGYHHAQHNPFGFYTQPHPGTYITPLY